MVQCFGLFSAEIVVLSQVLNTLSGPAGVGFGVGVNCGRAVVGNIGCSFRMDYTAIGDTVNTAARLEANAKRGQVLISQEVYDKVKDRVTVEPIGTIPLKGKSKEVFVYSLTGLKDSVEAQKEE
jgi:class 3 adenylate cyclase